MPYSSRGSVFLQTQPQLQDKAYKRFAAGVERSLALFDTQLLEWADYISFLGRLLKSLQAQPVNITIIPSKAIVARRLAQCLNPTLPSGVHQKAIEVYNYIFTTIGPQQLSKDLQLYLPGLAPTLSFASLTVRSPYLTLLETHLLDLEPAAIRPALKSLILALLPGLEEETSEDFEQTLRLVNGFRSITRRDTSHNGHPGDEYFWQCFFLASITGRSRRAGALAYLNRHLPRLGGSFEQGPEDLRGGASLERDPADVVTSPEPGLLIRCFAAGLQDDQMLIQRGYLDLLVSHLPLHATLFTGRVTGADLVLLMEAACGVTLRRDMSLNRRLWSWLQGPTLGSQAAGDVNGKVAVSIDTSNSSQVSPTKGYFERLGQKHLTHAIVRMASKDPVNPTERAKPYRICLSLMDQSQIAALVIPAIFLPAIKSLRRYQTQCASKTDFQEVLRSAKSFYEGIESGLIWTEIVSLIIQVMDADLYSEEERLDALSVVRFILGTFKVHEDDMIAVHGPAAAFLLLFMITSDLAGEGQHGGIVGIAIDTCQDLVDLIPSHAFNPEDDSHALDSRISSETSCEIIERCRSFYSQNRGCLEAKGPPVHASELCSSLWVQGTRLICLSFSTSPTNAEISARAQLASILLSKVCTAGIVDVTELLTAIRDELSGPQPPSYPIFSCIVSLLTAIRPLMSSFKFSELLEDLVSTAWHYLSPSAAVFHVEAVRILWQLQACFPKSTSSVEACICRLIAEESNGGRNDSHLPDAARRFSTLWTHSLHEFTSPNERKNAKHPILGVKAASSISAPGKPEALLFKPLFLVLGFLATDDSLSSGSLRAWLRCLPSQEKLFQMLATKLAGFIPIRTRLGDMRHVEDRAAETALSDEGEVDDCVLVMEQLAAIFRCADPQIWSVLANNSITRGGMAASASFPQSLFLDGSITYQRAFFHICLAAVDGSSLGGAPESQKAIGRLQRPALIAMNQILSNPFALQLARFGYSMPLLSRLRLSLQRPDDSLQPILLEAVYHALRLETVARLEASRSSAPGQGDFKKGHREFSTTDSSSHLLEKTEKNISLRSPPPSVLIECLRAGLEAQSARGVLDHWVQFMADCLPLFSESIFQLLIPVVETFCSQITSAFELLKKSFATFDETVMHELMPVNTLNALLDGLETILVWGHKCLVAEEATMPSSRSLESSQGFFGTMVSGASSTELPQFRTRTANDRLTVLLSFGDAVRTCFKVWAWGNRGRDEPKPNVHSLASFNYTSLRVRNRSRRILEQLFRAEPLECLETVISVWQEIVSHGETKSTTVFRLLQVLDCTKPKHTIPKVFDAIYSRANPGALDPMRKSTLTNRLEDTDIVVFLIEYLTSLDDDAMDEIWAECMAFLKDILTNPVPHRGILSGLLEFTSILGQKVDNTNFREQRKMRRELGDLFMRLLTATFTTTSTAVSTAASHTGPQISSHGEGTLAPTLKRRADDLVGTLSVVAPNLTKILVEGDRVVAAVNIISTNLITPAIRSKSYPDTMTPDLLAVLYQISRLPNTQKTWKKDVMDAFNDNRFFTIPPQLCESHWAPILRRWALHDKERMVDLLGRLAPPSTAGIVFGVGASSARLEADRKTQLTLRRMACLVLSLPEDQHSSQLRIIYEKLSELLQATPSSSPSSATRADVYLVLRSLLLKTSPIHMAFMWPTINAEVGAAISSIVRQDSAITGDLYTNFSLLQACKLLDTILCIAPDDFQLAEWLFVTDTIDAIYRPSSPEYHPASLVDEVAEELGMAANVPSIYGDVAAFGEKTKTKNRRQTLLGKGRIDPDEINMDRRDELITKIIHPFCAQLSIWRFESVYNMGKVDLESCRKDCLHDVFDERGITKAL